MTEKNADVEWLQGAYRGSAWRFPIDANRANRLLAYIDRLEADLRETRNEWESARERAECVKGLLDDRRPTIHEIAAGNMQGIMARGTGAYPSWQDVAADSYDAAEALVAEGRRRDGL